jgi:hypothetical protein
MLLRDPDRLSVLCREVFTDMDSILSFHAPAMVIDRHQLECRVRLDQAAEPVDAVVQVVLDFVEIAVVCVGEPEAEDARRRPDARPAVQKIPRIFALWICTWSATLFATAISAYMWNCGGTKFAELSIGTGILMI